MRFTLSGPPGSGKTTVARLLSSHLNYPLLTGGDIFRRMAQEMGMDLVEFSRYAEENWEIDRELDARIVEEARKKEDIVIDSRLSGWMLHIHKIPAFKVYIDASPEVRIRRIWEREGGDIDDVRRAVEERERSELKRYREIYGIDFRDKSIYDMVINSDELSPEEILRRILEGAGIEEH